MQIPAENATSASGQIQSYLPQCVAECKEDLDEEARRCFMNIPSFEDGDVCDEALDARRSIKDPIDIPFWEEKLIPTE